MLDSDRAWLGEPGHHLVTWDSDQYPALLRDIPSPPAALFVDGEPDYLWRPQLAVIGSRNPTAGGRDNARDFATELSRQGLAITSGMASGIDSVAHHAALDSGGVTIAVTGTGPDVVYPSEGSELAQRIRHQGALVSEFPPGTPARRQHFPSRNRIISGLSLGVLVIEAGLRSGTLITARQAANQGREVFALPGSIHNPMAKGCHRLIRDGARLIESVSDITQELAALAGHLASDLRQQLEASSGEAVENMGRDPKLQRQYQADPCEAVPAGTPQWQADPEYRRLWDCLGYDPKPVEAIIEQCGLTAREVSAMLLMLELRGEVEAHPGGTYNRITRG